MIVTVLGQKGHGKTSYLAARLRVFAAAFPSTRIYIHDCRGWATGTIGALAPPRGRYRTAAELRADRNPPRCCLLYQCPAEDLFELGAAHVAASSPALLICDELDRLPPQLRNGDAAYVCLHYGRLPCVDTWGSARQPQNIDKGWLSQADELVIFRLRTGQVLRQIEQIGSPEAVKAAAAAPNLPRYKYIVLRS